MPNSYPEGRSSLENTAGPTQIKVEDLNRDIKSKLDRRNVVTHQFTTVAEETIPHKLGRVPIGAIKINQSAAGTITGDISKWTNQKIYLTSSVAPNNVSFLLV